MVISVGVILNILTVLFLSQSGEIEICEDILKNAKKNGRNHFPLLNYGAFADLSTAQQIEKHRALIERYGWSVEIELPLLVEYYLGKKFVGPLDTLAINGLIDLSDELFRYGSVDNQALFKKLGAMILLQSNEYINDGIRSGEYNTSTQGIQSIISNLEVKLSKRGHSYDPPPLHPVLRFFDHIISGRFNYVAQRVCKNASWFFFLTFGAGGLTGVTGLYLLRRIRRRLSRYKAGFSR